MSIYTYGQFQINANTGLLGYFLTAKDLSLPVKKPSTSYIPRSAVSKKSGEAIEPRSIPVVIKVVGSSRPDLISRLDALQQALDLRSQPLCIHEDGRTYQAVDALSASTSFKAGSGVVQCEVQCVFMAYDPFAYAATPSTYDTGTVTLSASGGSWAFPTISITGGGTTYAYPFIRVYNRSSTGSTTLSAGLTNGTGYTSISVNATTFSAAIGDTITITHSSTTQTLTVATAFSVGTTTITVSSFTASANYVSGDVAAKVTQWTNITITQMLDSLSIATVNTGSAPLPANNGDYVDIQCSPTAINGWSIQTNNSGNFSDPIGLFPVVEPIVTPFAITIVAGSQVSAEAAFTWTARYLS